MKNSSAKSASRRQPKLMYAAIALAGVAAVIGWLWYTGNISVGRNNTANMPMVKVLAWDNKALPPALVAQGKTFALKADYSKESAQKLAFKLLGTDQLESQDGMLYGYTWGEQPQGSSSAYTFVPETGAFSYASAQGKPLTASGSSIDKADAFLRSLVDDPTLTATATYRKKDRPGVTFVEFHRDWQKVGLPILNALGLLNTKENQTLADITLTSREDRISSSNIHQTSDNADGLARANDFNTATIGINDQTNSVTSVVSNIRQFKASDGKSAKLISYDKAVQKLTDNRAEFIYTTPAGAGLPAFDKVYPSGGADAKLATVTERTLAYLEEPQSVPQDKLEPYYLFRGTAELTNGHRVKFVAGVRAVDSGRWPSISWISKNARAVEGGGAGSSVVPNTPDECIPATTDLANVRAIFPGVNIGQLKPEALDRVKGTGDNARTGDWYAYSTNGGLSADDVVKSMEEVKRKYPDLNHRNPARVKVELGRLRSNLCPVRLTGKSPTIFVYGPLGTSLKITPTPQLTYADPALDGQNWPVNIGVSGAEVNGFLAPYIYYESVPASYTKPSNGWVVKKGHLPQLAKGIAKKLALTALEQERLLVELQQAALDVSASEVFVGLLPQAEVDQKLALTITPKVNTVRLHFYLAEANGRTVEPGLTKIERTDVMVLELGAVAPADAGH
jgi:hypothetical protein